TTLCRSLGASPRRAAAALATDPYPRPWGQPFCYPRGVRGAGPSKSDLFCLLLVSEWRRAHDLVRGDSHFATPGVFVLLAHRQGMDFVLGLAGNAVLLRQAAPIM